MSVIKVTQTNAGSSTFVVPDYFIAPFNIGFQAVVVSGAPTYTVQYTMDDTQADDFVASTAQWNSAPAPFAAAGATQSGSFTIPCRGIRVTVTGTGVVTLTICQSGTR